MPQKYFNVAGPCSQNEHYMINPLRSIGNELNDLIDAKHYFVIHAARQSGKTTLLKELARKLNREGKFYALYCSLESLQGVAGAEKGIPSIIKKIKSEAEDYALPSGFAKGADLEDVDNVLKNSLTSYCRTLDKSLVLLFDEADCLSNGTLISFLRQLRNGYINRSDIPFVHSLALVGMRNIRDYKAKIRDDRETLGSSSPFNIVSESFNLSTFTHKEVSELYAQHTAETGQIFEPQAVDYMFEQTDGQPWLANAVARECVDKICKKDYTIPITKEMAKTAIKDLILKRPTHFDSLMERLKEERVRKIIQPLLLGEGFANRISDDYLYAKDLGLIKESGGGVVEPANQIYAEIMVRTLNYNVQEDLKFGRPDDNLPKYIANGKININALLTEFQAFWRENSEIWLKRYKEDIYQYDEAAPHLVIQAFLQRVINGGGQISREMALGKSRADICVEWEGQKYPIELKIFKNEKTIADGIAQLSVYMDRCGAKEGWLVVFDRSSGKPWEEKLYMKEAADKGITIFGC